MVEDMEFVTVGNVHIRVGAIADFWYSEDSGNLYIDLGDFEDNILHKHDPDRTLYRKLCADLGVEQSDSIDPVEENEKK